MRYLLLTLLALFSVSYSFAQKKEDHKYMVTIKYKHDYDALEHQEDMVKEKKILHKYVVDKIILEAFVTPSHTKGWIVMHAASKDDIDTLLAQLPL